MTKEELLNKLESIIDKSIELVNTSEEAVVGRIVLLANKVSEDNVDAILEMAILGVLSRNK